MVKKYQQRETDEEIKYLEEMGGEREIAHRIKTDVEKGLDADKTTDLEERAAVYGVNTKIQPELPPFCEFVMDSLDDRMLQILIVAAVVQIVLGVIPNVAEDPSKDWIEGVSLTIAITVVVMVGSVVNYRKEKQFKELNDQKANKTDFTVKRNGKVYEISEEDLLTGDVVKISSGNIVPSDAIVLSSVGMKIDESAVTGESDTLDKESIKKCLEIRDSIGTIQDKHSLPSPVCISGSQVNEGEGWILCLGIGPNSEKGKIQLGIINNQEDSKTPLEIKLEIIAEQIGWFGVISAVFTCIALFIRLIIVETTRSSGAEFPNPISVDDPEPSRQSLVNKILKIFLLGLAIVVVAIPEGMPLAVTLSLAFSVKKMMDEQNLVRKMHSCETMGNANFICSDKTGTLTQNNMTLNLLYDGSKEVDLKSIANSAPGSASSSEFFKNKEYYEHFKLSTILNLQVEINEEGKVVNCSNTDKSFLKAFISFGEDIKKVRDDYYPTDLSELRKFPFKSDRKKMSVILRDEKLPGSNCKVMMKGAAEIVLESCNYLLDPDTGEKIPLGEEKRQEIIGRLKNYADQALRCIVVAFKDIDDTQYESWKEKDSEGKNIIEKENFTFVCLGCMKDVLREGVQTAVEKCQGAGINVVMITGDNLDTACAIAKDCGIMNEGDDRNICAMEGKQFYEAVGGITCQTCSKLKEDCKCPKTKDEAKKQGNGAKPTKEIITNEDAFKRIVKDLKVIARSRVDDKYALILGLRKMDNIVAVTGDKANDAKALSRADVGFAMGVMGTDIAKEAADIVILDDNFASIVNAVKWGRNIYDNIRKFIVFQLTVNVCSVLLVLVCAVVGNETPIVPIQMLWLNLIMDSLGSLSLATDPLHKRVLEKKPYPKGNSIINTKMWKHILLQSLVLFIVCFAVYIAGHKFILEDEDYRKEEIANIWRCYGKYPGHDYNPIVDDDYKILSGSVLNWPEDAEIITRKSVCGKYYPYKNMPDALDFYKKEYGNTSHMTIVFNIFVMWSLLNQINARGIDDNINVFYKIKKNKLLVIIFLAECGAQIVLVQFGASLFKCSYKGLTAMQWLICLFIASLTYPCSILFKIIPLDNCIASLISSCEAVLRMTVCRNADNPQNKEEDEEECSTYNELDTNRQLIRKKSTSTPLLNIRMGSKKSIKKQARLLI